MADKTTFDAIAKFIGQNDKKLIAQTLNGLDFVNDVRTMRNASLNGTLLPKMTVAKGIRNLNLNVETRSGSHRNWSGRKLLVYPGMKIIDIIPEEVYNTFLSDMMAPGVNKIPFAQWVWEKEFEKIASEINDNIHFSDYKGDAADFNGASVYNPGDYVTFGTEEDIWKCITLTTAGQSPSTHPAKWQMVNESIISTGWDTIIKNEIAGSTLSPIITGALSTTNTVDKVELMFDEIDEPHRKLGGEFKVSPIVYDYYLKSERTKYAAAATPEMGVGVKTVYGNPNWVVKKCNWMGTSKRIIATQKDNLVFGTNIITDATKAGKTIETLHGTKTVVKWIQGCEISDIETLYVNDQA